MISVIAGSLIFAAMTYIGFIIKNQYSLRLKFLRYMSDFANFMLREVSLYKTPINTVIGKFILNKQGEGEKILLNYQELGTDKSYENIYSLTDYIYLKAGDRTLITDYLYNLGKGNLREEKKYIEQFIREVDILKNSAEKALEKDGKLASQLMALIGFALMIIVV